MEGLLALVSDEVEAGEIQRLRVARGALVIYHQFYADDSLFFEAIVTWKYLLHRYELAIG